MVRHTVLPLSSDILGFADIISSRNISEDSRTSSAQTSNANLIVGGATSGDPQVAFQLDAVQFEFPQLATEDVISMSVNFMAQETTANKGGGGEVTVFAAKSVA